MDLNCAKFGNDAMDGSKEFKDGIAEDLAKCDFSVHEKYGIRN